jgi:CheY-like chemotaxis protein
MDCMMPIMNGFEATVAIRGNEYAIQNRNVPIIAMTANATLGDREKCIEFGMNDYLSKPVRKEELAALIEKWLVYNSVQEVQTNSGEDHQALVLFDKEAVLERMDNDIDFVRVVLDESLQALVIELDQLRALCHECDAAAIRRQAHSLKGMSVNIGAPSLRDICLRVETAARDNDLETACELLPELEHVATLTAEAIRSSVY